MVARFGQLLFLELPLSNPFGHEERFEVSIADPELKVVTSFGEWQQLRRTVRPCVGQLGPDPVEMDLFDVVDGAGRVQLALLPHETLHVPLTFLTLLPYVPPSRLRAADRRDGKGTKTDAKFTTSAAATAGSTSDGNNNNDSNNDTNNNAGLGPSRVIELRVVSCTHGHVVAVVKVVLRPRPFVLQRTVRFFEPENSLMRRRVRYLAGDGPGGLGLGWSGSRFVHCVETTASAEDGDASAGAGSRVVVEWGPCDPRGLELLLRVRVGGFPSAALFYLLFYRDPHRCRLQEVLPLPP